jgi:serine phosphatase RsbU (regulator of sigma subunit)
MKRLWFLNISFFFFLAAYPQTDAIKDSLFLLIEKTSDADTAKVFHYHHLTNHLQYTNPVDAEKFAQLTLQLAEKQKFKRGIAMAYQDLGEFYNAKGLYEKALEVQIKAAEIYETLNDYKKASVVSNANGNTYLGLNKLDKALEFYQLSARQADKAGSKLAKSIAAVGIGNVYSRQGKYKEAIQELRFAQLVFESANKDLQAGFVYSNMAESFNSLNELDSATHYARKALPIMEKYQSRYGIAFTNLILGNIDLSKDKYNSALNYYFRSLQISEEDKAIDNQKDVCFQIFKLFEKKGNTEQALHYYKKFITLKDSLYNSESRNKLFELQTKYDTEAKDKENLLLQQDQMIAKKSLQTQRILFYFIALVLLLVFVFTYFAYKNLKKQKRMNLILKEQKELVEQSKKEILDSILYAKRIQSTILAHKDFIDRHLKENFVFYKPKDIVSGDFYWATRKNNLFYLAVCDSTGHGVPGAFMSLLSISFLNEAIGEKNIVKPNEVFNYVRLRLIDNISKEGQKDGFDGALFCFNQDSGEITYTAANNKPVVVSTEGIRELESDRMPVGYGERKEDFKLHQLSLKKDDILYLFTDGYADQFGGPKGKKMMYKRLYEQFQNIASNPFERQPEILNDVFESWRGKLEQVDDVCVIGIRL